VSNDEAIRDLSLMLMYLTSWTERGFDEHRFWKGYDFDVLDDLEEAGLILSSRKAKSAYLTEQGLATALRLLEEHGLPQDDASRKGRGPSV
jgi:hypothetical protein